MKVGGGVMWVRGQGGGAEGGEGESKMLLVGTIAPQGVAPGPATVAASQIW